MKLHIYLLLFAFVAWSCDEEDKLIKERLDSNPDISVVPETGELGSLDLSRYVAIGNSLTSGFQDGALYTDGQMTCFPALLSERFGLSGLDGESYSFPDINSVNGYYDKLGDVILGKLILDLDANNDGVSGDIDLVPAMPGDAITPYAGDKSVLTNFGVPKIVLAQLRSTAVTNPDHPYYNPYYARFASKTDGTATILGDALARNPTFFTLWIGANDVLGYAIGGGVNDAYLTDPTVFTIEYANVLGTLDATVSAQGGHGVVLNIPPVIIQPFFQAVKYNDLALDEASATALNTGLAGYNGAVQGLVMAGLTSQATADFRKVNYAAGKNPFLIEDDALTDYGPEWDKLVAAEQMSPTDRAKLEPYRICRPIQAGELMLLSSKAVINTTPAGYPATALYGLTLPLPDKYTLSGDEVTKIVTQRATLNGAIAKVFQGDAGLGLPGVSASIKLMDIQPLFADLAGLDAATAKALYLGAASEARADGILGLNAQGFNYQPDFSPNGLVSNDGLHPNPRGHAVIANEIIKFMNTEFGSSIPEVQIAPLRSSPFQF